MQKVNQVLDKLAVSPRAPLVLTVMSCAGVIATGVMAARAAPKATYVLDEAETYVLREGRAYLPFREKFKLTWKIYIPVVGVGAVTIMTIITANRVSERNAAILSAGAALATTTLKEYQQNVLEMVGSEKESKIRDKVAKAALARSEVPEVGSDLYILGDGEATCYDSLSGRYFKHVVEDISRIENELNKRILADDCISLNDLYYELGLEPIELGELVGFNTDHMIDIHFSSQLTPQKQAVVVLSHFNMPIPHYNR